LLEELESRVLLSQGQHVHEAYTSFVLYMRHVGHDVRHQDHLHPMASSAPVGLTPSQIRQAYGVSQLAFAGITNGGMGQTIAIVDAYDDPNIVTDLVTFDTQFGLPAPVLTRVNENGGGTLPGTDPSGPNPTQGSWAMETSLDVEWVHAIAPKASILLVEASSSSTTDLYTAVNEARNYAGVSVVSMSWGGSESGSETIYDSTYFTTPSSHGNVTFVASTGDSGAYKLNTTTLALEYPAASPNVLSVGGTQLTLDSYNNYSSESGWGNGTSSGTSGGAGGGISKYESQPTYQKHVVTQSSSKRTTPDVSMDAAPVSGAAVVDSWDFGSSGPWVQVGGTSLAAPLWAGVIALANQDRASNGLQPLDGPSQTLPALYSLSVSKDFHDITTGNNGYAAAVGYDLVTGIGTPIINQLVPDLSRYSGSSEIPVITSLSASPSPVVAGATLTLTASGVQETSGTVSMVSFYMESNGTAGLQIGNSTPDTLLSNVTPSGGAASLSLSTSALSPGTYTYYAVATDSYGQANVASSTTVTVQAAAPVVGSLTTTPSSVTEAGSFTLTAGSLSDPNVGGSVSSVAFYRESNGTSGLQTGGATPDTLLSTVTPSSGAASLLVSAASLTPGAYTYYAVATDNYGAASTVYSTIVTVEAMAPAIGSFATTPNPVSTAGFFTLTVGSFSDPNIGGSISSVAFYMESNGTSDLQTSGSTPDTLLSTVMTSSGAASLQVSAASLTPGTYTCYAVATDNYGAASTAVSTTVTVVADGLAGAYYPTMNFTGASAPETDSDINFNWGTAGPAVLNLPAWNSTSGSSPFSVQWTGSILADTTGLYALQALADDGIRVIIDGTVVINAWHDTPRLLGDVNLDGTVNSNDLLTVLQNYGVSGGGWQQGNMDGNGAVDSTDLLYVLQNYGVSVSPQSSSGTINLAAGWHTIEVDYYQKEALASVQLNWTTPDGSFTDAVIPASHLSTAVI